MCELSIIIVSYNTRDILRDCLESVYRNAPESAFEIIVVDNASHDGSVEMITAEFPDVVLIANKENKGFAAANNQGFSVAQGIYWLLLNSDTVVLAEVLQKSLAYMQNRPLTGMLGCKVLNKDRSLQETCFMWPSLLNLFIQSSGLGRVFPDSLFFRRERMHGWKRDSEREVDAITGCYLLVRAEMVEKIGYLDEDFFFYGEETDWCRRCREAGYRVMFAPVGEIIHLGGASGTAVHYSRKLLWAQAIVRLQRKYNGLTAGVIAWLLLMLEVVVKSFGFGMLAVFRKKFFLDFKKNFGALLHFSKAWAKKGRRRRKVLLAVASAGGHWMQLRRLDEVCRKYDTVFVTTKADYREAVVGYRFFQVKDVNRWKKWLIPLASLQLFWIVWRVRPDAILSTGALPGLLALFWGRVFGARGIWLDSIANSEELSMSGRFAGKIAGLWLTQWEELAGEGSDSSKPEYAGKVL